MQKESFIVKAIIDYLRYSGHVVVRVYAGGIVKHNRFIPQGNLTSGTSDIVACIKPYGVFLAVEVKTEKGKLTKRQGEFLESVKAIGGYSMVAKSVDDVELKIKEIITDFSFGRK